MNHLLQLDPPAKTKGLRLDRLCKGLNTPNDVEWTGEAAGYYVIIKYCNSILYIALSERELDFQKDLVKVGYHAILNRAPSIYDICDFLGWKLPEDFTEWD